ncbi:DUF1932 domain-containing protein [Pseudogemmobacter sp. W21_MBD1_M6]|uniref:NAD(P)-dependent oxidoreductase n=1 Tax=Pseudogemmobacter sp. W21_MBD1_M6 TaxID=3240271 RepID=UPI003F95E016
MSETTRSAGTLAFIGFGEAGSAFVSGFAESVAPVSSAYDIKLGNTEAAGPVRAAMQALGVREGRSPEDAMRGADLVFCVVTADQAVAAARAAAPHLPQGAMWLDCNSCAPGAKRQAAAVIESYGGIYVDVAVMAPVHPKKHRVPLLLAGPEAQAAALRLAALGMTPTVAGLEVGQASTIKMLRSVMIKGMEALTAECVLAARKAGVQEAVIGSLQASDPATDWTARSAYNLERMAVHGQRRAAEMREVVQTLRDLDLPARMAAATAEWQDQIGAAQPPMSGAGLLERADAVLAALGKT